MKRLVFALVIAGAAGSASAANLFTDPNFDSSLGTWASTDGTSINRTSSDDVDGNPASGALEIRTSNGINGFLVAWQCVTTGVASYDFQTAVKLVSGVSASMRCDAYSNNDCSGTILGSATASGKPGSAWSTLSAAGFAAPAGTQSIGCQLQATQPLRAAARPDDTRGFAVAARFDAVLLQISGTPVSLQSFEIE